MIVSLVFIFSKPLRTAVWDMFAEHARRDDTLIRTGDAIADGVGLGRR